MKFRISRLVLDEDDFENHQKMDASEFEFLEPGELVDRELCVVLARCNPADPVRQWVPSYDFDLVVNGRKSA